MQEEPNTPRYRELQGDEYYISIMIYEKNREAAIKALEETLEEIKDGVADCSAHDDTYMPYLWWTCYDGHSIARLKEMWKERDLKNDKK